MKIRNIILAVALCSICTATALADENSILVSCAEPLETLPDGVSVVAEAHNIYLADDQDALQSISALSEVEEYDSDDSIYLMGELTPDDPDYLNGKQWYPDLIGANWAWHRGITGEKVRVAVIDSGFNMTHEDLIDCNYAGGYDLTDGDDIPDDVLGHGTFVTGVIAAGAMNGVGIAGLTPDVELVSLKCFSSKSGSVSHVVSAIYKAVDDYSCDIINLSVGTETNNILLRAAVQYTQEKGVILIAAAGNSGKTTLTYPAAYENVIGVGAEDRNKIHSSFSQYNESVDVVAPGSNLYGLDYSSNNGYKTGNGTSFAAPCVTAAVAMAKSIAPALTEEEIMTYLKQTSLDLGAPDYDVYYGNGMLQIDAFLREITEDYYPSGRLTLDEDAMTLYYDREGTVPFETREGQFFWATYREGRCVAVGYAPAEITNTTILLQDAAIEALPGDTISLFLMDADWKPLLPKQSIIAN